MGDWQWYSSSCSGVDECIVCVFGVCEGRKGDTKQAGFCSTRQGSHDTVSYLVRTRQECLLKLSTGNLEEAHETTLTNGKGNGNLQSYNI